MINGYVFLAATLPMIAVSAYKNPAPTPIRSPKRASDWILSLPLVTVRIQPIILMITAMPFRNVTFS